MNSGPRGARRGPARSGGWLPPLGRNTWYLAIAAAAVLGLTAGGVALLAGSGGGPRHEAAPDCGLINCGARLPGPGTTISTQSDVGKVHTAVSHPPAAPAKSAPPASSAPPQAPAPAVAAAANVSVTFSSNRDRRGFDHFQEQMTLVNNGGSPVSGWTVRLTLPGDGIDSVEIPSGWEGVPFEHWQFSGDTLTISADISSETLGPGAPLNLSIHGQGKTASPTGCAFDGSACPVQQDQQPEQPGQFSGQQAPQTGQPGSDQPGQRLWPQAGQGPRGGRSFQ